MPPRHTYWTIILEGMPTAFRAHTQDELLPTLRQLQSTHPDVQVGSYPFFENKRLGTYVVLRSTDADRLAAAENALWKVIHKAGFGAAAAGDE